MLVLSREQDQSIMLLLPDGQRITVLVTELKGSRVKLGFTCPNEVKVLRPEAASPDQWRKHPNGSELADRLRTGVRK